MAKRLTAAVRADTNDAKDMVNNVFRQIRDASAQSVKGGKFFPDGIELIFIKVKVSKVEFEFKIAGPKAAAGFVEGVAEAGEGLALKNLGA